MDGGPLGKHMISVLLVLWILLHVARCNAIRGLVPSSGRILQYTPRVLAYQPFLSYQQPLPLNQWNGSPFYFNRPNARFRQNQAMNYPVNNKNYRRVQNVYSRRPPMLPVRSFRTYNSRPQQPRPRVITRVIETRPLPEKKISVITGPLSKVAPHPKKKQMRAKKRLGYRLVAKAKSFPGILKDTSLDVTKV